MALITCPECSHDVSDQAAHCPNCGHPFVTASSDTTPVTETSTRLRMLAIVTIASGALIAVGSIMPWRTAILPFVGTINVNGTEGDGIITLILGAMIAATGLVVLLMGRTPGASVAGAFFTAAAGLVAYLAFQSTLEVIQLVDSDVGSASIGVGLWLIAIGIVGAAIGTVGTLTTKANG
ncbi:MAG: zinc ribbon domain-containing protein [Acidimicrobiia bacterium]|nr:zinc ribbon domain-containing protein [Acidimicrobiia bacterium]